jgi:hypothetical protein
LISRSCKNDHIIFNVGTPSLEARNIRLVNIIRYAAKVGGHVYVCYGYRFPTVSKRLRLYFGTVLTVLYCMLFILFYCSQYTRFECSIILFV